MSTENLPGISAALGLPFGQSTPFTCEVWFVSKTEVLDLKWGTIEPMQLMDPVYGILLPVRAFSQYGLRVVDSRRLLAKLVGTASMYTADQLNQNFRGAITSRTKVVSRNSSSSRRSRSLSFRRISTRSQRGCPRCSMPR